MYSLFFITFLDESYICEPLWIVDVEFTNLYYSHVCLEQIFYATDGQHDALGQYWVNNANILKVN